MLGKHTTLAYAVGGVVLTLSPSIVYLIFLSRERLQVTSCPWTFTREVSILGPHNVGLNQHTCISVICPSNKNM